MRRTVNRRLYVQAKDLDYIHYIGLDVLNNFPKDLIDSIRGITEWVDDYTFIPFKEQSHIDALNKILNQFTIDYDDYKDYNVGELENEEQINRDESIKYEDDETKHVEWLLRKNHQHLADDFKTLRMYKGNEFYNIPKEPRYIKSMNLH